MQMKRAKLAYKNAIKAHQMADDSYFSNDLHELLLERYGRILEVLELKSHKG